MTLKHHKQRETSLLSAIAAISFVLLVPRPAFADDCAPNAVPDASIIAIQDTIIPTSNPATLMDPARNTQAYREEAFAYFESLLGVQFDVTNPNPQVINDLFLFPFTGGTPYQVLALDIQNVPSLSGKYPLDSVEMPLDGYAVTSIFDTTVFGQWGGPGGRTLPEENGFIYGEYRIKWSGSDAIIDTITNRSVEPNGRTFAGLETFPLELSSPLLGEGFALGVARTAPMPGTVDENGPHRLQVRNVLTFGPNRSLFDPDSDNQCDSIDDDDDDDDDDD